jgi:calcium-dependent protein kinase
MAVDEVKKILERVDADGSGEIDYSEWIVATINKEKLLSPEKLKTAFSLFDKDGGGSISADEVKDILCQGQNIDDAIWDEVIRQVDEDGNGEIDFEEFSLMMRKMVIVEEDLDKKKQEKVESSASESEQDEEIKIKEL